VEGIAVAKLAMLVSLNAVFRVEQDIVFKFVWLCVPFFNPYNPRAATDMKFHSYCMVLLNHMVIMHIQTYIVLSFNKTD